MCVPWLTCSDLEANANAKRHWLNASASGRLRIAHCNYTTTFQLNPSWPAPVISTCVKSFFEDAVFIIRLLGFFSLLFTMKLVRWVWLTADTFSSKRVCCGEWIYWMRTCEGRQRHKAKSYSRFAGNNREVCVMICARFYPLSSGGSRWASSAYCLTSCREWFSPTPAAVLFVGKMQITLVASGCLWRSGRAR